MFSEQIRTLNTVGECTAVFVLSSTLSRGSPHTCVISEIPSLFNEVKPIHFAVDKYGQSKCDSNCVLPGVQLKSGPHGPYFNPLNAELNPICHLLALLGAHLIFHVSGLRVNISNLFTQWQTTPKNLWT